MKIISTILLLLGIVITGCAKKTHILDSTKSSKSFKISVDSTLNKDIIKTDRSVTTTERYIDSSLIVVGKVLVGEIDTKSVSDSGVINQHVENNDLELDLTYNKKTGKATAKATPRPKTIPFKIHEKTVVNNDIKTADRSVSKNKISTENKVDTNGIHKQVYKDPTAGIKSFKSVVVWVSAIVALLVMLFFYFKK